MFSTPNKPGASLLYGRYCRQRRWAVRTYLAPVVADHVDVGQEIGRAITADETGAGEGSEDS